MQVNYLLDHGAISVDSDGTFSLTSPRRRKRWRA